MSAAWPHLRAAFVAFHLVALTVMAFPAPGGGLKRSAWADPTVQAEFDAWHGRLQAVGYARDRAAFEEDLWAFASAYTVGRTKILVPFRPYYTGFGTIQSWRMFVAPHRFPSRLELAVLAENKWQVVYLEGEPGGWLGPILDHDRMRSGMFMMAWPPYKDRFHQLSRWLGARARADFPDASRLRVRYLRQRSLSPAEVRAGVSPKVEKGPERYEVLR